MKGSQSWRDQITMPLDSLQAWPEGEEEQEKPVNTGGDML